MDEGVLEGIVKERYGIKVNACEQLCTSRGEDHCEFKISRISIDFNTQVDIPLPFSGKSWTVTHATPHLLLC